MSEKLVQLKNNLKNLPLFERQIFLEQGTGIEPASVAWEATILPMN